MTTKQLMHNIITFCNNYINNENVLFSIDKYPNFISVDVSVWKLHCGAISHQIGRIDKYIHNEDDFHNFIDKVTNELPELLEKIK